MKRIVVVMALLACASVSAQEKPKADEPKAPTVDARAAQALQEQARGYLAAQAVLQKEIDALESQFQREVAKLQQTCAAVEGYQLGPKLTCEKKPEPAKKDPPK